MYVLTLFELLIGFSRDRRTVFPYMYLIYHFILHRLLHDISLDKSEHV